MLHAPSLSSPLIDPSKTPMASSLEVPKDVNESKEKITLKNEN